MADPTIAYPGMVLAETGERAWRGKVWQRGEGHRSRAIDTADSLGHDVLVGLQCADGTTFNSTSFATARQYNDFMRKLAAEQPTEQRVLELWVRGRGQRLWYPTFDIKCDVACVPEEEVLRGTVGGLQAFFLENYGVAIATEDIVLLRSAGRGGHQKVSFLDESFTPPPSPPAARRQPLPREEGEREWAAMAAKIAALRLF